GTASGTPPETDPPRPNTTTPGGGARGANPAEMPKSGARAAAAAPLDPSAAAGNTNAATASVAPTCPARKRPTARHGPRTSTYGTSTIVMTMVLGPMLSGLGGSSPDSTS